MCRLRSWLALHASLGRVSQEKARSLAPLSARGGNAQAAPPPCRSKMARSREGTAGATAWGLISLQGRSPRSWERAWPQTRLHAHFRGLRSCLPSSLGDWDTATYAKDPACAKCPATGVLKVWLLPPFAGVGTGDAHRYQVGEGVSGGIGHGTTEEWPRCEVASSLGPQRGWDSRLGSPRLTPCLG